MKPSRTLRAKFHVVLALAGTLPVAHEAAAQETPNPTAGAGFSLARFDPSDRGSEWFANESLDLRGHGRPAFGVVADFAYRPLVIFNPDGSTYRAVVRDTGIVHVGGAVNLWDRVRVSLNLPLQLHAAGSDGVVKGERYSAPANATSVGDLRVGADVRLLGTYGENATLALGVGIHVPTGDPASYSGDGRARVAPRLAFAGDAGMWTYAARVGLDVRARSESVTDSAIGTSLTFAGAVGLRLADEAFVVGPEIHGSALLGGGAGASLATTPLEALFGFHYTARAVRFGVGGGAGLTEAIGSPVARVLATLEWMAFLKREQARPEPVQAVVAVPECAADAVLVNGTCVPRKPSDEDNDGIADKFDACREVAGVADDDPMRNGCPADRDADGVPDASDACPTLRGVRSDDPKKNGCPPDRDGDGVEDSIDACIDQAGVGTTSATTNGCPDPDRDKDGVANEYDACPDEAGNADADPKKSGCPKAFVRNDMIRIVESVKFNTGSAVLSSAMSNQFVLDAVLKILSEQPNLGPIRVEGHTDDRGVAAKNRKLSADRAAAVVKWLVVHGIDPARLRSVGYGPDRPIDTNETAAGRENNRRVEFHIEK